MAAKKHKYEHTHITHHKDGSHSIHHHAEDGNHLDYARGGHDSMMDGMMQHTSDMNQGEPEAMAGAHGVPPETAAPAGLPAAPAGPMGV